MEREPDSLVDQYLDALYDRALKEDAIPWNDADDGSMKLTPREVRQLEETLEGLPDEP